MLFREGDVAEYYYVLKRGKVVLEFEESDGPVSREEVGPGMGIGCSSLAGLKFYSSSARCTEDCTLLRWEQKELRHLFNEDSRLGYLMIKAMAKLLTKRVYIKSHEYSVN
ncbi:MAG: Crp/Fnr family transcriptional regulator [Deltaproteobacteria bacterium]|nr:Crp/Fnr family transcriptional regulator [Deltaproteobacteria bacterium]